MATAITASNPKGSGPTDLRKFSPPAPWNTPAHSIAPAQGNVFDDIAQGVTASQSVTGPSRVRGSGKDVVVVGQASAPGVVTLETSQDGGATWPLSDSEAIPAGEYVVSRAVVNSSATHYRVRFTCGPVGASKVSLTTQART